jgi:hypothetical protein
MEITPKHVRFTHTPLNFKNKEIRLLTIEPSSEPSRPIQITIKHVDLGGHIDALTRYREEVARLETVQWVSREQRDTVYDEFFQETFDFIALSYTWGPESPAQDILVTSAECRGWLSVRQNLYEFLKMRRDCGSAWFWIDQICINQGKDDEKAHQVNQMAEVYSVAAVEVWLGPGFEGSDELMDVIIHESVHSAQIPGAELIMSKQEILELVPSVHRFVSLPYWTRLWVIQEVILSRVVDIRIGSKTLSWNEFFMVLRRLRNACHSLGITEIAKDLEHVSSDGGNRIWKIECNRDIVDHRWDSIGKLVWGAECSDLRDRVFGAMGMVRPPLRIFPDYSMQPQDVLFMLLTKHVEVMYPENNNLEQSDDRYEPNWGSWVVREFRHASVDLAASWLPQLDDNKNRINTRSVRRHLLKILPLDPPMFDYRFGRTWQFKCYLWYKIPNERSMWWRLGRAGVVRLAHALDRIR